MQSFDTKDSNTLESFDRKFESFDTFSTKDSEMEQSDTDFEIQNHFGELQKLFK